MTLSSYARDAMTYCGRINCLTTTTKAVFFVSFLATFFFSPLTKCMDFSDLRRVEIAGDEDYDEDTKGSNAGGKLPLERACPFGWQLVNDHCYLYAKQPAMQWSQAERYCAEVVEGGHLVSVKSKEEMEVIFALITAEGTHWFHREHQTYHSFSAANDFIWVGLAYLCPEPSGNRWSDGTKLNPALEIQEAPKRSLAYSTYSGSQNRGKERCVAYHLSSDGGKLTKAYCLDYAPFVCKVARDANKTQEINSEKDGDDNDSSLCDGYDWCYNNGSCYKILSKEQSWYESRTTCQSDGGELVSIHSISEIDYLNNNLTVDWSGQGSFWTGLNKLESMDDRFQWSDNSPVDFLPFVTVEVKAGMVAKNPSCVSLKVSQLRRLLAKSPAAGKMRADEELQTSRCDVNHPAICKKRPRNTDESPSPPAATTQAPTVGGCQQGWMLFKNRCYRAFGVDNTTASERENFLEAQKVCAKYKANLVSIQNNFDNLFVLSLLTGEDFNQSWIGLIYNDGRLRWIDESEVTYTNFDQYGMATFGITRATPSPSSSGSTTPSYSRTRTSDSGDYLGASGLYSPTFYWRQQERCVVMSIDKAPGTWDSVSSSGSLSSIVSRAQPQSISPWASSSLGRGKRSMYWPYDWRRSLTYSGDSCEQLKLPFVCEKSKSRNESSGDREWECNSDTSKLNRSYFKHGSSCYEIITDTPQTWDEAKKYCEQSSSSSSSLTSILNQQEFAFLVSVMKKRRDDLPEFWIGMRVFGEENTTAAHAEWADQWPVWITKWNWNQYPVAEKERNCVIMTQYTTTDADIVPYWRQEMCQKKLPFVCKHRQDAEQPPKPKVTGRCEADWVAGSTQCYLIRKTEWTSGANAMLRCWREHNATLASFPTLADWRMISKNQDLREAKRRFFIGLIQKVHGTFEWIDGNPLDFVNWAPQEPRFGWNPSLEVCVEMDQNGLWYDAGCHETRHYICSKPKDEDSFNGGSFTSTTIRPSSRSPILPSTIEPPSSSSGSSIDNSSLSTVSFTSTAISAANATSANKSQGGNLVSGLRASPGSKSGGANTGVIAGIVVCAVFFLILVALGVTYLYRRHTQGFPLFRRRSSDAMRFEILNERNDEY